MDEVNRNHLLVVLGPTASGKTRLAALAAYHLHGEIISADSRQIYRKMDLGTGKDYGDYQVGDASVRVHLTDIRNPGEKYSLFEYQKDFLEAYQDIRSRNALPILCGGSGLYIEAVVRNYRLLNVPVNEVRRKDWESKTDEELKQMLVSLTPLHNTTDIVSRKRLIRALEIAMYQKEHQEVPGLLPVFNPVIFGVRFERMLERERITTRLKSRLEKGMVQEVEQLLAEGILAADLMYYGLEYKWITLYVIGRITYDEMFRNLNIAIHQFAKRQRTWFRRMERNGIPITWLRGEDGPEANLEAILRTVRTRPNFRF